MWYGKACLYYNFRFTLSLKFLLSVVQHNACINPSREVITAKHLTLHVSFVWPIHVCFCLHNILLHICFIILWNVLLIQGSPNVWKLEQNLLKSSTCTNCLKANTNYLKASTKYLKACIFCEYSSWFTVCFVYIVCAMIQCWVNDLLNWTAQNQPNL